MLIPRPPVALVPIRANPFTSNFKSGVVAGNEDKLIPIRLLARSPMIDVFAPLPINSLLLTEVPPFETPGPRKMLLLPDAIPVPHPM